MVVPEGLKVIDYIDQLISDITDLHWMLCLPTPIKLFVWVNFQERKAFSVIISQEKDYPGSKSSLVAQIFNTMLFWLSLYVSIEL